MAKRQKNYAKLIAMREARGKTAAVAVEEKSETGVIVDAREEALKAYRQALIKWEMLVTSAALSCEASDTAELNVSSPPQWPFADEAVNSLSAELTRSFDESDLVRHCIAEPNKPSNWITMLTLKSRKCKTSNAYLATRKRNQRILRETHPYIRSDVYMMPKYAVIREGCALPK